MRNILRRSEEAVFQFEKGARAVDVLSDAAVGATHIANGRLIPLVILALDDRPDVRRLIDTQHELPPGDVISAWGVSRGARDPDGQFLLLKFLRPVPSQLAIRFDMRTRGSVIELALKSKAIWLQAGSVGDRAISTWGANKLLVELGAEIPIKKWRNKWHKALVRRYVSEGCPKAAALALADAYVKRYDELSSLKGLRP